MRALAAATLTLFALTGAIVLRAGAFNYALDDAYIHLSCARNLVESGAFGVRPGEFVLLSSSPLFTLALAATGPSELAPLVLASIGAVLTLVAVDRWHRPLTEARRAIGLAIVIAIAMLGPLILTGLEHTLHIAAVLFFSVALVRGERRAIALALPLVVLRYESLFLIASAGVILALRGQIGRAAAIGLAGVLPAAAVGAWSVSRGGTALPSSILIKGGIPQGSGLGWVFRGALDHLARNMTESPHVLGMMALLAGLLFLERSSPPARAMAWLALGSMACWTITSSPNGFYRYELWMIALGACAAIPMFFALWDRHGHRAVLAWLPAFFALARALSWTSATEAALRNIRDQQIFLGDFLSRAHRGAPLVVNDIGYVTWKVTRDVVDYAGLATPAVTSALRRGERDLAVYDAIAKDARVALLFPNWFPRLPARFVPVARFTIPDNVCQNHTFVLYGLDPEMREQLRREARELRAPPSISIEIL